MAKRRKYADQRAVAEWREEHCGQCAACGAFWSSPGVKKIEVHHMLSGRVGRPDEPWNLLPLCSRWGAEGCHDKLGHGRENLAICLALKARCDPENYDHEAMQEHMQRFGREILPAPAPLPAWITETRE